MCSTKEFKLFRNERRKQNVVTLNDKKKTSDAEYISNCIVLDDILVCKSIKTLVSICFVYNVHCTDPD